MKPCQELSLILQNSDERRIKYCQFLPSMQSMSALRACQQHFVPRKQYLVETILAFVEALGHNVVMLHSDQDPVLVQLLKAVQSRRVKRNTGETWPESQPSESRQE